MYIVIKVKNEVRQRIDEKNFILYVISILLLGFIKMKIMVLIYKRNDYL